jgi:hypothetical protein
MSHRVNIRVPENIQPEDISAERWFKQTTKTKGVKTTTLFQRDAKPRSVGQKVIDFFSGIKKAKDSITLGEAFKCINQNTSFGKDFNVNLIPQAIEKLRGMPAEDLLDTAKGPSTMQSGKYTLGLE